jgi:cytochrome c peroxidase
MVNSTLSHYLDSARNHGAANTRDGGGNRFCRAPYMHDGSVPTLEAAAEHYAAGGRTLVDGIYRGVGHDNPNKSETIRGFSLSAEQRADLIAFLQSLTDEELLHDPRFSNPWVGSRKP